MQTKHAFLLLALAAMLLLPACFVYDETPTPQPEVATAPAEMQITPPAADTAPQPTVPPPPLPPSLYLQPSVLNLAVGEESAINVRLEGAQRLNGVLLEMQFDPNYVQVVDADPATDGVQVATGEIPQPVQVVQNVVQNDQGTLTYQVALEPGAAVDGGGIVASITLRGIAEGGSPLTFANVAAFDPDSAGLALAPLSDGLITVAGQAASQPDVQPPTAPQSQPTAAPATRPPVQPSGSAVIYYVVQPGENLYRIGLKFGTTAEAIAAASGIANVNQVAAGAMVQVPVAPPQGGVGYYVQPGDTLYSIAARFGMTADALAALNNVTATTPIAVGQILTVSQ